MRSEFDWITRWAELTPNKIAVSDMESGEDFTYHQFDQLIERIVATLSERCAIGDRVAVLMDQQPFLVALLFACQRQGLILVPINFRLSSSEITRMLYDSAPSLIIYSEHYKEKIDHEINIPICSLLDFKEIVQKSVCYEKASTYNIKEDNPLFLFYSSGTTSQPKGVVYTNKMLFWNSLNTSMQLEITSRDSTINILPPYHTSGWNVFVLPLLHQGGTVIFMRKLDEKLLLAELEKRNITLLMSLPTILRRLSANPYFSKTELSELRYIITGGEFISAKEIRKWKEQKNTIIRPGYGLTEAGPSITSLHQDYIFTKIGSVGKPNFYVEIEIRDEIGNNLKAGDVGEICIKSKVVTPGYWNNSVATRDKIKGDWLYTGDMGYKDDDGFIFIKGRKDDMYISGGENIYPKDIENVLAQHPAVEDCIVLPVEDSKWGAIGIAFVQTHNKELSADELINFMKDKIAKYKYPKQFVFLEQFPTTKFGKTDRKKIMSNFLFTQTII